MSNLNHGFTPIPSLILDALARFRIAGQPYQVIIVICRLTYGWHKEWACISYTTFQDRTDMPIPHIQRAIKELITMNLIFQKKTKVGDKVIRIKYCMNEYIDTWIPKIKQTRGVINNGYRCNQKRLDTPSPKLINIIDTSLKDNNKTPQPPAKPDGWFSKINKAISNKWPGSKELGPAVINKLINNPRPPKIPLKHIYGFQAFDILLDFIKKCPKTDVKDPVGFLMEVAKDQAQIELILKSIENKRPESLGRNVTKMADIAATIPQRGLF